MDRTSHAIRSSEMQVAEPKVHLQLPSLALSGPLDTILPKHSSRNIIVRCPPSVPVPAFPLHLDLFL